MAEWSGGCVVLAYSPAPRQVQERELPLLPGDTVGTVLARAGFLPFADSPLPAGHATGVWGKVVDAAYALREGDRVELYRALRVDPKVARRERFKQQGARASGLFARQPR